jgi:biopolymer transport protein TolR
MSFAGGGRQGVKAQINVTPLVDVTLVLLIIFIVVTPMLQRAKDVQLPSSSSKENRASDGAPLVVVVTRDKSTWIEDRRYDEDELVMQLASELRAHPSRDVLVKADEALAVGDVRRVMASAQRAGAKGVALGVKPSGG